MRRKCRTAAARVCKHGGSSRQCWLRKECVGNTATRTVHAHEMLRVCPQACPHVCACAVGRAACARVGGVERAVWKEVLHSCIVLDEGARTPTFEVSKLFAILLQAMWPQISVRQGSSTALHAWQWMQQLWQWIGRLCALNIPRSLCNSTHSSEQVRPSAHMFSKARSRRFYLFVGWSANGLCDPCVIPTCV